MVLLSAASLMAAVDSPRRLRDQIFNRLCRIILGHRLTIDWRDLKVRNPRQIHIGENFHAGRGLWLEAVGDGNLTIGANVNVSDWVHIGCAHSVTIGSGSLIGSKSIVTDHGHGKGYRLDPAELGIAPNRRPIFSKGPVDIGSDVWLGDGVAVLANSTIGNGCIIGANSVVCGVIPAGTIWAGIPAKQIWPLA